MTMPHKICPQCGQPAVPEILQCRRCGFLYAPVPPGPAGAGLRPPGAQELPRAQQAALQRRDRFTPLVLLAALGLGVLLAGIGVRALRQAAVRSAAFTAGNLPAGPGLNASPAEAAGPPHRLSFFVESDSAQEMPILTFRNIANDTLTLTLRDRYGHVYRASSRSEQMATLQVPAGEYSVSVENDNPHVRPNWGDAAFRRFKSYHADFIEGPFDERIHLGD